MVGISLEAEEYSLIEVVDSDTVDVVVLVVFGDDDDDGPV